tara:strand:+ start:1266 stop:2288 length:1023 start_codon:yes stop_codon:yes gene_type:complete
MPKINTIVLTVGDEAGVGPEIILKALASKDIPKNIKIIIVGSKKNLIYSFNRLKGLGLKNIKNPNELNIEDLKLSLNDFSKPTIESGNASFLYLKKAIDIVKSLKDAALVTAPICKKSWSSAGHNYSGQTELLAESCNISKVGMLFTAKSPYSGWRFNTLLTTTHIPLIEVSGALTQELISSKLDLLYQFCRKFNKKPTLKIAGLNPHAGEEGILGHEEKDTIKNTVINWNLKNPEVNIIGPVSPDSCWISSLESWRKQDIKNHDGILAMYHDQGLIPMKIIALHYSVNTTIGLPIIRTSPDHGTGFDIAGKGIAQSKSMLEAIKTANELINQSRFLDTH